MPALAQPVEAVEAVQAVAEVAEVGPPSASIRTRSRMRLRLQRPAWLGVPALARPVEAVAVAEVTEEDVLSVELLPSNPLAGGEARILASASVILINVA